MRRDPLVSVVITNYNYADFVGRAIASVQRQSFRDLEIVVVDNASTDRSVNVVETYKERDCRIRLVVNSENIGVVGNHKRGLAEARGIYMMHLDADDWLIDADAIQSQIEMLERNPEIAFVYSPFVVAENEDSAVCVARRFERDIVVPGEVAIESAVMIQISNSGQMMRMSALRKFGGYNENYKLALDTKLAIDLCGAGKVGFISRPLCATFQHSRSVGRTVSTAALQDEMCKAIETAFVGPLAGRIKDPKKLRSRALNNTVMLYSIQRIFNDDYAEGWAVLFHGIWRRPAVLLAVKPLLGVTARTILGRRGWSVVSRFSRKQPEVREFALRVG